jgi:hypothetical protein
MTNCLTTRRTLLADPQARTNDLLAHLNDCEACRTLATRLTRNEALLRDAVDIPVPEQLAERILLRNHIHSRQFARPARLAWIRSLLHNLGSSKQGGFALAASAVLALALSWTLNTNTPGDWSEVVLAHVISEENGQLKPDALAAPDLATVLKNYGLNLAGQIGSVRYVGYCSLPGGRGVHAVVDTPNLGEVTLVLPPIGTHAKANATQRNGYASQMLNINQASIGIVTQHPEKIQALTRFVHEQIVAKL